LIDVFCRLHEKSKSSDKIDQYILKVTDFVGRTRKLEDDILRYYCSIYFYALYPFFLFSTLGVWSIQVANLMHGFIFLCMQIWACALVLNSWRLA